MVGYCLWCVCVCVRVCVHVLCVYTSCACTVPKNPPPPPFFTHTAPTLHRYKSMGMLCPPVPVGLHIACTNPCAHSDDRDHEDHPHLDLGMVGCVVGCGVWGMGGGGGWGGYCVVGCVVRCVHDVGYAVLSRFAMISCALCIATAPLCIPTTPLVFQHPPLHLHTFIPLDPQPCQVPQHSLLTLLSRTCCICILNTVWGSDVHDDVCV